MTDRDDGTYTVEYCVPAEGIYQACVTLDGAHVAGSPASITAFRLSLRLPCSSASIVHALAYWVASVQMQEYCCHPPPVVPLYRRTCCVH